MHIDGRSNCSYFETTVQLFLKLQRNNATRRCNKYYVSITIAISGVVAVVTEGAVNYCLLKKR